MVFTKQLHDIIYYIILYIYSNRKQINKRWINNEPLLSKKQS